MQIFIMFITCLSLQYLFETISPKIPLYDQYIFQVSTNTSLIYTFSFNYFCNWSQSYICYHLSSFILFPDQVSKFIYYIKSFSCLFAFSSVLFLPSLLLVCCNCLKVLKINMGNFFLSSFTKGHSTHGLCKRHYFLTCSIFLQRLPQ